MKTFSLLIPFSLVSFLDINSANATVHTVTVQNNPSHFLPDTVYAVVGDTIHWVWVVGNHIVGPISASDIPAGAAMFNATVDAGHPLNYVLTAPGNYHYECHPAFPHGEPGYIIVAAATGISSVNSSPLSSVFPNPFADKVTIEFPAAELISVYNMAGQKIKSVPVKEGQAKVEVDMNGLTDGIYFYAVIKEGIIIETKKLVKN